MQPALVASTAGVLCILLRASGVGLLMEKVHFRDSGRKAPVVAAKSMIWEMVNGGEFHLAAFSCFSINGEEPAPRPDFRPICLTALQRFCGTVRAH